MGTLRELSLRNPPVPEGRLCLDRRRVRHDDANEERASYEKSLANRVFLARRDRAALDEIVRSVPATEKLALRMVLSRIHGPARAVRTIERVRGEGWVSLRGEDTSPQTAGPRRGDDHAPKLASFDYYRAVAIREFAESAVRANSLEAAAPVLRDLLSAYPANVSDAGRYLLRNHRLGELLRAVGARRPVDAAACASPPVATVTERRAWSLYRRDVEEHGAPADLAVV